MGGEALLRSVGLAIAALALALGVGEVALRLLGVAPWSPAAASDWGRDDAILGWTNRPGVGHPSEPGHVPMTFWPDGQRASSPAPKLDARRRVVVVGCSFTQGFGVADAETFTWRLNETYPDVRFENWGVGGYSTYQSLLLLERLLRAPGPKPDLVVYGFIGDHVRRNLAKLRYVQQLKSARGLFVVPPSVGLESDALAEHPARVVAPWPSEQSVAWTRVLHGAWLWLHEHRQRNRDDVLATNLLIERMDREVREAGARLLVAILSDLPSRTDAFLAEQKIAAVNCIVPGYPGDPSFQVGGVGHPSGRLHALWSECVRRALDAQGLLR